MSRFTRFFTAIAIAAGLATTAAGITTSHAHPTARIQIDITQGGFIIGGTNGSGYVRYHRRNYPVIIGGLRFGAIIGVSNASLTGRITNLSSLRDLEGTYTSIGASAAIGSGRNVQQFRNDRGVHLELSGFQDGLEMSLDVGGMTIELAN